MIISNQIKCNRCNDVIYSGSVHDFKNCKCGAVAVDGGTQYLRRVGPMKDWTDMSISFEDPETFFHLRDVIQTNIDTGRNALGLAYAAFRAFEECGYHVVPKDICTRHATG